MTTNEDIIRKLNDISDRVRNLERVSDRVFDVIEDDCRQRFNSAPEVRSTAEVYGGVTWPRLTEAYIKQAKRSGPMLKITGDLHSQFRRGGPGNVAIASQNAFTFGTNTPKARGLHRKRKLIFIHPELTRRVKKVLSDYVIKGIK